MSPRNKRLADQRYVIGERYLLVEHYERSHASHAHYFAAITEAWKNLPHDIADQYLSPECLRKKALIRAGYADERSIVCASKAEALRVAAFVRPMDEYAVVIVSLAVVKVFTAQSQSKKAMGAKVFQDSKQKVLDICAGLIGVDTDTLSHARAA